MIYQQIIILKSLLSIFSSRGVRNDASLVPPIRQTASIFKQPVTVFKTQESKVKTEIKQGTQEKPKQVRIKSICVIFCSLMLGIDYYVTFLKRVEWI